MFCTKQSSLLPYAKAINESPQTAYKNVVTAVGHRYKKYGLREGGVEKGEGARRTHEISGIVCGKSPWPTKLAMSPMLFEAKSRRSSRACCRERGESGGLRRNWTARTSAASAGKAQWQRKNSALGPPKGNGAVIRRFELRRSTARWKSCGPDQCAAYWANALKGKKRFPISRVGVMPEGEFA